MPDTRTFEISNGPDRLDLTEAVLKHHTVYFEIAGGGELRVEVRGIATVSRGVSEVKITGDVLHLKAPRRQLFEALYCPIKHTGTLSLHLPEAFEDEPVIVSFTEKMEFFRELLHLLHFNWNEDAIPAFAALSLRRLTQTEVPPRLVLPPYIADLCDEVWRRTEADESPKEWLVALFTDGKSLFTAYQEGTEADFSNAPYDFRRVDGLGLVLTIHTHPYMTFPSWEDLQWLLDSSPDQFQAPAHLVVIEKATILLLRDEREEEPVGWSYYASDRKHYHRMADKPIRKHRFFGCG